jgi:hypothetical protein
MAGPSIHPNLVNASNKDAINSECNGHGEDAKQKVVIIKLGGSSITDKTGFEVRREGGTETKVQKAI